MSYKLCLLRMRTAPRIVVESLRNLVARVSQLVFSVTFPERAFCFFSSFVSFNVSTVNAAGDGICAVMVVYVLTLGGTSLHGSSLDQIVVGGAVAWLCLLDDCDVRCCAPAGYPPAMVSQITTYFLLLIWSTPDHLRSRRLGKDLVHTLMQCVQRDTVMCNYS